MKEKELLFSVIVGGFRGQKYSIYTDGSTEGFGDNVIVINYFGALEASAYVKGLGLKGTSSSLPAADGFTEDRVGAAHSVPA
jgi:hypothetical protein